MAKSLVITEKPSVARDIVAALGGFAERDGFWERDDCLVTFSVGHLVELQSPEDIDPLYKRWTLDTLPILPEEFKLKPKKGASERIRTIKKLLERSDVDDVVNACDAGREGELIFREILHFLGNQKPTWRLWLQSMTTDAIRSGFFGEKAKSGAPRQLTDNGHSMPRGTEFDGLGDAAACRSRSDWLIGMNATRALTRRLQGRKEKTAWSAGRVQTPTLALLVDRELEILSHEPVPYWRVEASFEASGHAYTGTWFDPGFRADEAKPDLRDDRIFDVARANAIVDAVGGRNGLARETRKPSRETAPPLFDLTSLQREANRRFGWSARRTLNAAQRCYEGHKLLTYPRTDSRCLPDDYRETVDRIIDGFAQRGPFRDEASALRDAPEGLQNTRRTFDNSKVSDHFAIIPTGSLPSGKLGGDDARLFDLVTRRFLACFHPPAIWNRVERVTEVGGESFRSRSRTLEEPGWRAVMGQTEQEDQALPPLLPGRAEAGDIPAEARDIELLADVTRPPARITEARLLSLMESAGRYVEEEDLAEAMRDKGIGTPATRADIIENLIAKGYLVRGGKSLRPTVKGIRLVDVLRRIHAERLASPTLTGDLEYRLNEVEQGRRSADAFMDEIVEYTRQVVEAAKSFDYDDLYPDTDAPLGRCPLCERPVFERSWFYRCAELPGADEDDDCSFRIWKDRSGRFMDPRTVRLLLDKGETPELDGFTARDGRVYSATLALEDGKLELHPIRGSSSDRATDEVEYDVDPDPLAPCPLSGCAHEDSRIVETPTHFRCGAGIRKQEENLEKARVWEAENNVAGKRRRRYKPPEEDVACPFALPRTVCKRELTRDEALEYVRQGRTGLLEDFTSRFGRPFSATLILKPNGRHGFEFPPRAARKAGPKAARKRTTRKAGSKQAARGKAARKRSTSGGTGRKKATRKRTGRKAAGQESTGSGGGPED